MLKIVAYKGFGQAVEPSHRKWALPQALQMLMTVLMGAATVIAAFFFLFVVVAVLLAVAVLAIAAYTVRRLIRQTRSKIQQRGHRVTRVSVLRESPSEPAGTWNEYWSNEEKHSST